MNNQNRTDWDALNAFAKGSKMNDRPIRIPHADAEREQREFVAAQAAAAIVDTLSGLDPSDLLFADYDVPQPADWLLPDDHGGSRIVLADGRVLEVTVRVVN